MYEVHCVDGPLAGRIRVVESYGKSSEVLERAADRAIGRQVWQPIGRPSILRDFNTWFRLTAYKYTGDPRYLNTDYVVDNATMVGEDKELTETLSEASSALFRTADGRNIPAGPRVNRMTGSGAGLSAGHQSGTVPPQSE